MTEHHTLQFYDELVSCFITRTCQLLPKSFSTVSDHMHDLLITEKGCLPLSYCIMCGSAAELYIRPLNSCIGDNDVLISQADELAFSDDFQDFPSDMSGLADRIKCFKIEPYHEYPGFVGLRILGDLNYNWKYKMYEINYGSTPCTVTYMAPNIASFAKGISVNEFQFHHALTNSVNGPAIKSQSDDGNVGVDSVRSLFCPRWPAEAKDWPTRPRKYGWPTIDTISNVVQNGCHVVYAQHRSCREDKRQWRLSFSVAEVILLQSWTLTQQIVYHLLRYLYKRELIERDCPKEDEVLCSYHLKTLMLWTCEEMSSEWWNSSSVIAICSKLLQKLSEWLKRRYCPNYFISEANLFHEPSSSTILDKIERRISDFGNSGNLSQWFEENYILPVMQSYITVEGPGETKPYFMFYLLPFLYSRKTILLESLNFTFSNIFRSSHNICRTVFKHGSGFGLRHAKQPGYDTINSKMERRINCHVYPTIENTLCFMYFENLLFLLHGAYSLNCGEVDLENGLFVELINKISMQPKIVKSKYHNFPKTFTIQSGKFQFLRTLDIMQNLTGSNRDSEFQLVSLVSKEFLRNVLEYDDSESYVPAVLMYQAALQFAASEYQQSIRLCLTVLKDQTSRNGMETLNAGCLLYIDNVVRIVGFTVLHKKIIENKLHYISKRLYLDLRLSPKLFAYYLGLAALCAKRMVKQIEFHHDLPDSSFPMDKYLTVLLKQKCIAAKSDKLAHLNAFRQIVYCRPDYLTKIDSGNRPKNSLMDKETVIEAMVEIASEHMTSFHNVIRKDLNIQCNTAECYRALSLYKRRQYDEVLHLCDEILHEPDLQSDVKEFTFANVLLLPPFDSFYDADVQSSLGFHTLFCYLSTLDDDKQKSNGIRPTETNPAFELWHESCKRSVVVERYTFACTLKRNLIKCRYFLGRHFLARYLKVRCCIDSNRPCENAVTEFTNKKTERLFEHIIRRIILRKLRMIRK